MATVEVQGAVPGLGVLALALLVLLLISCMFQKKRQTEGTYRPSAEEQRQARGRSHERPGLTLPLPKEERLI